MTECLLEMLTVWLKCTNPPPTWNILIEALESPPVGERLLAQQLRDKYCQRTEERVTHGYPSEGPSSVGHSTPQGSYPQCASPYSMPPQPHPSNLPPWSTSYYSPPPTSYPGREGGSTGCGGDGVTGVGRYEEGIGVGSGVTCEYTVGGVAA